MKALQVNLGEHSYPIYIEQGTSNFCSHFATHINGNRVVLISNETVWPLYGQSMLKALSEFDVASIIIPDGESHKTLSTYESIMTQLLEIGVGRDVTLIALGGGVVGDLVGFVAATFQRGVAFIQVPTTLLAQVDSSVGGKTAVNHPLGKNMIGAFYQPQAVLIDSDSLLTLPAREYSAGLAEVIKYGILGDEVFFDYLADNVESILVKDSSTMQYVIERCCQMKAEIVSQDEKEKGLRAILNLGHTFGHAIEAELGFGTWLHGEAVAAGMVLACRVAQARGWLTNVQVSKVVSLLEAFDLPTQPPANMGFDEFIKHMKKDKKVANDKIRFILPKNIGKAILVNDVSDSELKSMLA